MGVECSDSTYGSTTRICTRGDDAGFTCACTARPTRPGHIPPSWKGGITCRTHISTAWRQRIRSGGKTMPRGSNWTNGFHELDGSETDRAYERVQTLWKQYGQYQGQGEGQPLGPPSTICLPHTKGTTPDKDTTPTESEPAGSNLVEGDRHIVQGHHPGAGVLEECLWQGDGTTPRPRGQGKHRIDRGDGAAKTPRMESSSSDRRDESEESMSGSTQERPGRGGRQAARPMTPPGRPPLLSTSPRRSPRLSRPGLTKDFQRLPLSAKSDTRRTAHSRSASEDERGRHQSRSSRSSSDHGQ